MSHQSFAFGLLSSLLLPVGILAGGQNFGQSSSAAATYGASPSGRADGACPSIWATIARDLRGDFSGCTRRAADALRFAFHDSAGYSTQNSVYDPASGGADGSLLLSDSEITRPLEAPLQDYHDYLLSKYNTYRSAGISAADFVQFAGSVGTTSCAGGPVYKTVVGRQDNANAAPDGTLPSPFGAGSSAEALLQLWADKGFNGRELAALMGAHSVSRAFAQERNGIPKGSAQDSTPQIWDTTYYSQSKAQNAPPGVYRFASDVNLANANGTDCAQAFSEFANDQAAWAFAFKLAMYRLSVLGIPDATVQTFTDCTSLIIPS